MTKKKPVKKDKRPTLAFNPRFNIGDPIYILFWDDDIGAWNVEYCKCVAIRLVCSDAGNYIEYCTGDTTCAYFEDDDKLYAKSLDAAEEARRRNNLGIRSPYADD